MTSSEQTVQCPICGNPYKVYAWFAGDQSACPDCIRTAEIGKKCDRMIEDIKRHLSGQD